MTIIEFLEKDAVENICSSLAVTPQRVILIGDNLKLMQRQAARYKAVLAARGMDVEFLCRSVNKNSLRVAVDALSQLVETYEDCAFDLTGGADLYLVAAGIVFERYRNRNLQLHRFNIRNGTVSDCDRDGRVIAEFGPELSVEEGIRVYGGDVRVEEEKLDTTYPWQMDAEFRRDVRAMWDLCRKDPRLWNTQCSVFHTALTCGDDTGDPLAVSVPTERLREAVEQGGGKYVTIRRIIGGLYEAGLLTAYQYNAEVFSLTFKNPRVRRCLTVAGSVLEMKVFLLALEAREKDGSYTYSDAMQGVRIDWDGDLSGESGYDTENEIDVLMMHGMVPVFVSCKNGFIEKDELYKLDTVAKRFGGAYAKKVLVATSLDDSDFARYLRQRAEDMGIRLVEGKTIDGKFLSFTELDDEELTRIVRSFWSN